MLLLENFVSAKEFETVALREVAIGSARKTGIPQEVYERFGPILMKLLKENNDIMNIHHVTGALTILAELEQALRNKNTIQVAENTGGSDAKV